MSIKEKITDALKKALKEKDSLKTLTLRQVLSAIKNAEIDKKGELTDEEIGQVLLKEIKKRKESVELYRKGKREELAEKEEKEIKIIEEFLPEMLSEEEIGEIVEKTIEELSAGPQDFGKVMGKVMGELKGKADGAVVAEIVKQKLGIK
ncbi:GatB/YqeY domain-containing protein [bacterium]|nr:GatB/YqeY domain-containing protein [bacterium]